MGMPSTSNFMFAAHDRDVFSFCPYILHNDHHICLLDDDDWASKNIGMHYSVISIAQAEGDIK